MAGVGEDRNLLVWFVGMGFVGSRLVAEMACHLRQTR